LHTDSIPKATLSLFCSSSWCYVGFAPTASYLVEGLSESLRRLALEPGLSHGSCFVDFFSSVISPLLLLSVTAAFGPWRLLLYMGFSRSFVSHGMFSKS
jgi:hypothetical protein